MNPPEKTGQTAVRALVLTGFGLNCDLETQYALNKAGAAAERVHLNEIISLSRLGDGLAPYHILAIGGGFSWADDHGAGVLLGLKLKSHLGEQLDEFIRDGKLVLGICNGFQALVNMGLLPGFDEDYTTRSVAITANDCGNFRDDWVHLTADPASKSIVTKGLTGLDLPVRHGEGKFYSSPEVINRLKESGQVALRYAYPDYSPANGEFPYNPNGSLDDIAGICDQTGRIFGLMPHPEAFHHFTNHPLWTRKMDQLKRGGLKPETMNGQGLLIFQNAVEYVRKNLI